MGLELTPHIQTSAKFYVYEWLIWKLGNFITLQDDISKSQQPFISSIQYRSCKNQNSSEFWIANSKVLCALADTNTMGILVGPSKPIITRYTFCLDKNKTCPSFLAYAALVNVTLLNKAATSISAHFHIQFNTEISLPLSCFVRHLYHIHLYNTYTSLH